jgi:isoleucyl-tRNA synthetase
LSGENQPLLGSRRILAFTADEAWEFAGHTDSVHQHDFPVPDPDFATTATIQIAELQKLRDLLMLEVDKARKEKLIGGNLEAAAVLEIPAGSPAAAAVANVTDAAEYFILSDLLLTETPAGSAPTARITRTTYKKCLRCWRHLPGIGESPTHPDLCTRCAGVLGSCSEHPS